MSIKTFSHRPKDGSPRLSRDGKIPADKLKRWLECCNVEFSYSQVRISIKTCEQEDGDKKRKISSRFRVL